MNYVVYNNGDNRNCRNGFHGTYTLKKTFLTAIVFCLPMPTLKYYKVVHHHARKVTGTYTVDKYALLNAFIYIESKGVNDTINKSSGAVGCLQIMPVLIDEANRLLKCNKYTLSDRTNRRKSVEIFHLIMKHKNPSYDIDLACKVWHPNGRQSYTDSIKKKYNELTKSK